MLPSYFMAPYPLPSLVDFCHPQVGNSSFELMIKTSLWIVPPVCRRNGH